MPDGSATVLDADVPRREVRAPSARARLIVAGPELVAAAMAGFAVGPMLLLVTGHFSAWLGVPLGVLGAVIACRLAGTAPASIERRDVRWTVLAIVFAVCWLAFNLHYTAQNVYATRDPATYTITGRWLVDHGSLQIATHPEVFGDPSGAEVASGSYAQVHGTTLNAQGDHLLPVFLGLSGAMFGTHALLDTNTVLAALALLVFFGLARRLVGPALGFVVMAALALSMPMIYLGRDSYTEPLTLLYLAGALSFIVRGARSHRPADWAVAGLAAGAATCVRVDSYGALIGMAVGAAVFAGTARPGDRAVSRRCLAALLAGAAAPLILGWLDLTRLSQQYYSSQHGNITHLALLALVVAALVPATVALLGRPSVRRRLGAAGSRALVTRLTVGALIAVFAALASRPWWQTTHGPYRADLVNMQVRWHAAVDGTRTYNEWTVRWLTWYYGWPTVVLGVAGYAVMLRALVLRRAHELAAVVATGLSMSALYLWTSEVAPDQPWAMRRYVPVVVPLTLIAAATAIRTMWQRRGVVAAAARPVAAFAVVIVVVFPLLVSWPMRHVREEVPQLGQLTAICRAVGPHGAVMETDEATVFGYGQSIRSFCKVPTIGLTSPSAATLAGVAAAASAHGRTLYLLTQDPKTVPYALAAGPTQGDPPVFSRIQVSRWPNQIDQAPTEADTQFYAMWLSTVDVDGPTVQIRPVTRS